MSASTVDIDETPLKQKLGLVRLAQFGGIGLSGVLVNTAALALSSSVLHLHYLIGAVIATQVSTTWNYALLEVLFFKTPRRGEGSLSRYLRFSGLNHGMLLVRGPLLVLFTEFLLLHYLMSNAVVLVLLFAFRYRVSDRMIWGGAPMDSGQTGTAPPAAASAGAARPPQLLRAECERRTPLRLHLQLGAVALVAIPAVLVRIWQLGAVGFNSDEAVYAGQAASIAGDQALLPYFPIFRAHPLLFQTTLSLFYQFGTSPLIGRLLSVAFGLGTVALCYLLGRELYSKRVGLVAALLMAVMPYHVVVTRQVLLDGPMTFFATLSLLLLAKYARTNHSTWLIAAGGALGLTFLSKETSIVLIGGAYAFLAMATTVKVTVRALLTSMVVFTVISMTFPLSVKYSGKASTGGSFLIWQLFRRPNHSWSFYATTVPGQIGPLVLLAAAFGIAVLWRSRTWRESLLLCWIAVPVVFFQLWPVKGFQYLLPIAAPIAVLAARGLLNVPLPKQWPGNRQFPVALGRPALVGLCVLTLLLPTWASINPGADTTGLAGAGGVPGGREAGEWIAANVPEGAQMLTIGPSMANLVEFYGGRRSLGLSVSPNPLYRNPVYEPVINADLQLRSSEFQYLVWDSFSADRSPFFSDKLRQLAERYNGRIVHTESVEVGGVAHPIVVIYEVRP